MRPPERHRQVECYPLFTGLTEATRVYTFRIANRGTLEID